MKSLRKINAYGILCKRNKRLDGQRDKDRVLESLVRKAETRGMKEYSMNRCAPRSHSLTPVLVERRCSRITNGNADSDAFVLQLHELRADKSFIDENKISLTRLKFVITSVSTRQIF
ncbi:hypothetical protein CBL_13949 [Carabus blaptoides fortunei]